MQSSNGLPLEEDDVSETAHLPAEQLPSPARTRTFHNPVALISSDSPDPKKRKVRSLDCPRSPKRTSVPSESVHAPSTIVQWLAQLPANNDLNDLNLNHLDDLNHLQQPVEMGRPPLKRLRSTYSTGRRLPQSGDGSGTANSQDKKYTLYKNTDYPKVLENMGSYMRSSKSGMCCEDRDLCDKLLNTTQPKPDDILFDDEHFGAFYTSLHGRSKARIYADLHPRFMPSVENLYICGREEFEGFIEGHNDPWTKCVSFYGPRPQPDHTYGFKWSNFSEQQRRKLDIHPYIKSYYTAREDIYFPFLTGEVSCNKQGLDLTDMPNMHSMTIVQRDLVDLYRRLDRAHELNRKVSGFSISHDDHGVRIYAHYPEINGDVTTYWRETLREFSFGDNKGKERWTCYQFTLNVCENFALPHLAQLKSLIDELPDRPVQSFGLVTTLEGVGVSGLLDEVSTAGSHDESTSRVSTNWGMNAAFRILVKSLERQLEQQRTDAKEEKKLLLAQLEQQRKESEQRQNDLMETLREALQNR